jgi:hypothetical protein
MNTLPALHSHERAYDNLVCAQELLYQEKLLAKR